MALALRPRLIIADEPTTALDVTVQDQILRLLKERRDSLGASIILVTHDLGVVSQICDRMAVMYAGRMVETGTVRDVLDKPSHPYTKALLAALPGQAARDQELAPIQGAPQGSSIRLMVAALRHAVSVPNLGARSDARRRWSYVAAHPSVISMRAF